MTTVEDGKEPAPPQRMPFYALPLDLPAAPLFQDAMEKNAIPQVPIGRLLRKFDGETEHETVRGGRRTFKLARLPRFLIVHHKRFTKNNFFLEKNPTIVNFPVRNLRLSDHVPVPEGRTGDPRRACTTSSRTCRTTVNPKTARTAPWCSTRRTGTGTKCAI